MLGTLHTKRSHHLPIIDNHLDHPPLWIPLIRSVVRHTTRIKCILSDPLWESDRSFNLLYIGQVWMFQTDVIPVTPLRQSNDVAQRILGLEQIANHTPKYDIDRE